MEKLRQTPIFRKAGEGDIPAVTDILKQAVSRMLAEGKRQWDNTYPNENHVRIDIEKGVGYVLDMNGNPVAYGAVMFDGEPAYKDIDGQWLSDTSYVVVHRMAVLSDMQQSGLGQTFLIEVEKLAVTSGVRSFKVDTNYDNARMLSLLKKSGFTYCGEIRYERGIRMAFEKLL